MMIVLDCSVAMGWLFEDESSSKGDEILDYVLENGAFVPNLWHLEVANVLLQASKKKRISKEGIPKRIHELSILPIKVDMLTHQKSFNDTLAICLEYGLSSYDAAYIELAVRRNLMIATNDRAMKTVSGKLDVKTF